MRIRSTVAGLVLGAGFLVLGAPIAMADNGSQPAPPTASPTSERARPSATTHPAEPQASTRARPAAPTAVPAPPRPAVVKPVGAPETGGGMEDSSSGAGALVIGGIALVVVAGGGSVAYRQLRKQS
jgi:hypothetical protein